MNLNVELISVLVAILAVGVGLAGLMFAGMRGLKRQIGDLREDMGGLRQETREEIRDLRQEVAVEIRDLRQEMAVEIRDLRGHLGRIDSHIGKLRERMAHVEGELKGLREAFVKAIGPN